MVGQDVLPASPAHGLPLGGGQGHQAQGRVGDGLRALGGMDRPQPLSATRSPGASMAWITGRPAIM